MPEAESGKVRSSECVGNTHGSDISRYGMTTSSLLFSVLLARQQLKTKNLTDLREVHQAGGLLSFV
jgi:hypothetical protein